MYNVAMRQRHSLRSITEKRYQSRLHSESQIIVQSNNYYLPVLSLGYALVVKGCFLNISRLDVVQQI